MTDIFISYSRKDKPWVKILATTLVAEGYDVWWDPEILPGQDYEIIIKEALAETKCVLTVWSKDSINSTWVKAESNKGLARNIYVPVLYHNVEPPMQFEHIQAANLMNWKGSTGDTRYQQLLSALDFHTSPSSEPMQLTSMKMIPWRWIVSGLVAIGLLITAYVVIKAFQDKGTLSHLVDSKPKSLAVKNQSQIGEYIDHGDGTVTDTKTHLMWKKCSEGLSGVGCNKGKIASIQWNVVIKQERAVGLGGYSDWRLPTVKELRSLIYCSNGVSQKDSWKDGGCSAKSNNFNRPTINQNIFPNTGNASYWSSLSHPSQNDYARIVYFDTGHYYELPKSGATSYVRLVRSDQ
ncbi:MAG: DUF1566 domain-containing protein [Thiotrichaceae bacterium]